MSSIFSSRATDHLSIGGQDFGLVKPVRRDTEAPRPLSAQIKEFSPGIEGGAARLLDPRSLQREKQAETEFHTQQLAQELGVDHVASTDEADRPEYNSKAIQAFLDYMAKTPEERYFESFLKSKGMTKEEFEALPPEEQQALVTEFKEAVKQRVADENARKLTRTRFAGLL